MLRIPRQSVAGWQFLRIPALHKTRIRPTRRPDKNFPAHLFNEVATLGERKRCVNTQRLEKKLVAGAGFEPAIHDLCPSRFAVIVLLQSASDIVRQANVKFAILKNVNAISHRDWKYCCGGWIDRLFA